jgi:type I restriction enzyme S subunit
MNNTYQKVDLGSVCALVSDSYTPKINGTYPYIGLEHIIPGRIKVKNLGKETDIKSNKTRFKEGNVLYGKLRPYLDKCILAEFEGICSTDILALSIKDNALNKYIAFLLHTPEFIQYANMTTSGVNHPRTSWQAIKKYEFFLPNLKNQKNITYILSLIQGAIEQQEKIIASSTELKKTLMQKIFIDGINNEPKKETEIGLIPKSWKLVKISDIALQWFGGGTPSTKVSEYWGGDIPWITSKWLSENITINNGEKFITQEGVANSATSIVPKDSLIFATRVGVGKIGIANIGIAINQDLAGFSIDLSKYSPNFIAYQLQTSRVQRVVESHKRGATIQGITRDNLKGIYLAVPNSLSEQEFISNIFKTLDNKRFSAQRKRDIYQTLFNTLLHQLMSGKMNIENVSLN